MTIFGFTSTDELLRTVLSLYMPTEDLPLPTLEEVLFCDSKTTSEEVGLSVYKQHFHTHMELHGCSKLTQEFNLCS